MTYLFEEYLSNTILSAMEGDDTDNDYMANVAIAVADVLQLHHYPIDRKKNNSDSELYRKEGNKEYKSVMLQKALMSYNKAMAYAPSGSLALKLAYSNRSAVLFSVKKFSACLTDCNSALAIDCPTTASVTDKLRKRKLQATVENENLNMLRVGEDKTVSKFANEYLKLKSSNTEIPCASADIEVIIHNKIPKVIARRDIDAGELVALEEGFVTWTSTELDMYVSCYYCRKLDLNLFPCDGCVVAMFCSKQCQQKCMAEYHIVECQIIGKLTQMPLEYKWVIKVLIKLRNMCSSWEELISLSYDYGFNRLSKTITVNEIYDGKNISSLLSFNCERHFIHGALYKAGLAIGLFLIVLRDCPSFLPQIGTGKLSATKAMARIMMYLAVYVPTTNLSLVTDIVMNNEIRFHTVYHKGIYPFIGKLKHSCVPNLQMVALNSSVALIASAPIKSGTELTVSQIFHWLETDLTKNQRKVLFFYNRFTVCTCLICSSTPEEWEKIKKQSELSAVQKQVVLQCLLFKQEHLGISLNKYLEHIYRTLVCINDKQFSTDYELAYKMLKCFQAKIIQNKLKNIILSAI